MGLITAHLSLRGNTPSHWLFNDDCNSISKNEKDGAITILRSDNALELYLYI